MKEKTITILPKVHRVLETLGEQLKLARLRRKLSAEQVSERAGINRTTLWSIEKGASSVTIAAYAQVLFVLGLEKDLLKLAADDEMGRRIQDTGLIIKKKAPKK
jgi:transcriptional regulator with XRE-family HTH domain